ncbi:MAG TPA: hypothetical protein VFT59_03255 [Candidatus Saccharimonadales bacterium]|nr:hypothetical protein [Candidatus Saccharimonadales bacterium]
MDLQVLQTLRHIATKDNSGATTYEGRRVLRVAGDQERCVYVRTQAAMQGSTGSLWDLLQVMRAFRRLKEASLIFAHPDGGVYWVVMDD